MSHDLIPAAGDPDHRYTILQQVDCSNVGVDQFADQLPPAESS